MLHVDQLRKIQLEDYVGIVGEEEIDSVKALAEKLKGKSQTYQFRIFWGRGSRNDSGGAL